MKRFLLAVVLVRIAAAQNPDYRQDPRWRAPDEAAARQNPLAIRTEAAAGGHKLFLHNCAECHRPDGSGMESKRSADLHLQVVQAQTDGTLFWKITNGNAGHGMPSFSKLPELQRWQLVLYIRSLKRSAVGAPARNENAASQGR